MFGRKKRRITELEVIAAQRGYRSGYFRRPHDPYWGSRTATGVMLQLDAEERRLKSWGFSQHEPTAEERYRRSEHALGNAVDLNLRDNHFHTKGAPMNLDDRIEDLKSGARWQRAQAQAHIDKALEFERKADVLENADVVRVRFPQKYGIGKDYAYRVPEGFSVNVGDTVVVNAFNAYKGENLDNLVEVVARGRGGYTGKIKDIAGVIVRPPYLGGYV